MDGMNDGHSSDMSHGAMKCEVHSSVRVDVLCGSQSWRSCCHWCRYRASSPRKHNFPITEFSL